MERAAAEEKKITELEEELRVVGSNLQQLEVGFKKKSNKIEKWQEKGKHLLLKSGEWGESVAKGGNLSETNLRAASQVSSSSNWSFTAERVIWQNQILSDLTKPNIALKMKTFIRLKMAETQAENSEMNIQRLNIR